MLKYSAETERRKANSKNTKRYGHSLNICRYPSSLRRWELPMRTSFTDSCPETKKSCWHFSMKSQELSARKNYSGIEKAFIICRRKEEQSCTLQAEPGGRLMKLILSLYRLPPAAPGINAGFAACIKTNASECRPWKNLKKI